MFERGYRRQLEADLVKWVAGGVISGDAAQSIRKVRFDQEAVSRLPAIFAMLGALMLAASVSAFVAANWQEIPRLVRLVGILMLIAGCFFPAWLLERRGMPRGADAAITLATLCFGAGVALVGQMYHLPADWPAGALLIAIGGLVAAALTAKNGPLVIAFVAMTSSRSGCWLCTEAGPPYSRRFCHGAPGFSDYCSALKSSSSWKSRSSSRMPSSLISIQPMERRWSRWRLSRCWGRKETKESSPSSRRVSPV